MDYDDDDYYEPDDDGGYGGADARRDVDPDDDLFAYETDVGDDPYRPARGTRGRPRRGGGRKALACLAAAALVLFIGMKTLGAIRDRKTVAAGPATAQPTAAQTAPGKDGGAAQTAPASPDGSGRYIYSQLGREDRELYDQICAMLAAHEAQTELRCSDASRPFDVYFLVLADHPEFFWAGNSASSSWHMEGNEACVTLKPDYTMSASEAEQRQKRLDVITEALRARYGGLTDYEKVRGVYEYIIGNSVYELSDTDQSLCPVLLEGRGVCSSYAKSTQYLLQQLGVEALYVSGQAKGGSHAWNVVKVDGDYYHLDTTWGDPIMPNGEQVISYDYFCVTGREILIDHTLDTEAYCPECTAVDANYFRREGRYFTSCDPDGIERLFERDAALRQPVRLRASDRAVFDEILRVLFQEGKVFDILDGLNASGTAPSLDSYSKNDQLYTLEIRLQYD